MNSKVYEAMLSAQIQSSALLIAGETVFHIA